MIKAKNIHKSYGELEVLKGVNLEIHKGEIVSIVGESGAGKSTLLQILGTLDLPSDIQKHETEILLFGESFLKMNDKELSKFRNENIGFVFQHHQLLPEFTALENVMMPIRIAGKNVKDYKEKAIQLFEDLNVVDRIHYKPKMLSGGEAQRVAVIRALINSPKIIFADEPTGNLDSKITIPLCLRDSISPKVLRRNIASRMAVLLTPRVSANSNSLGSESPALSALSLI